MIASSKSSPSSCFHYLFDAISQSELLHNLNYYKKSKPNCSPNRQKFTKRQKNKRRSKLFRKKVYSFCFKSYHTANPPCENKPVYTPKTCLISFGDSGFSLSRTYAFFTSFTAASTFLRLFPYTVASTSPQAALSPTFLCK